MKYYNTCDWLRLARVMRLADTMIRDQSTGTKAKYFRKSAELDSKFADELIVFEHDKITINEVETLFSKAAAKAGVGYKIMCESYKTMLMQAQWEGFYE